MNKLRILQSINDSFTPCFIRSSCFGILRSHSYGCGNVGNKHFRKINNFIEGNVVFIIT